MKRIQYSIVLLTILMINGIQGIAQETVVEKSAMKTLRIDPSGANGGSMSQVFSEINFIPLETTNESLFGDIAQLEITKNSYVIFDRDTKSILTFDKTGKFKSKIELGKVVRGRNLNLQNLDVYGFSIKGKGSNYTIQVSIAGKRYEFDANSKQLNVPVKETYEHRLSQRYDLEDNTEIISYYKAPEGKDKSLYQYVLSKNGQVSAKYFEVDTGRYSKAGDFAVGGPSFIETDDPNILHAVRYYDYNIYQIDKNGISIAYQLVFPSTNTIPSDFNTNKLYFGKKINYFFKKPENIFGIGYTYKIGDYLYFKCGSLSANLRKIGSFVYDLKHDYLISLNRLDPDNLSHFLPILGGWDNDFKKFDGKYLYASLSSLEMFAYYEQEKKKNHKYPAAMQKYFSQGNKKDNPVLIQLKPKKVR